jgi:hypothetical protein
MAMLAPVSTHAATTKREPAIPTAARPACSTGVHVEVDARALDHLSLGLA